MNCQFTTFEISESASFSAIKGLLLPNQAFPISQALKSVHLKLCSKNHNFFSNFIVSYFFQLSCNILNRRHKFPTRVHLTFIEEKKKRNLHDIYDNEFANYKEQFIINKLKVANQWN